MKVPSSLPSSVTRYITTPIFYVNAKPHLGHFYSMVLADVHNRWNKFSNRDAFFITGTDEHGLKVQVAAGERDPKEFCDEVSSKFKVLAQLSDVKYDRFIRTTDPDHLEAVQYFWKTVWDNGYIYKGTHSGWYSISDEAFYPEKDTELKVSAEGKEIRIAKETGNEVIFEEEENYFFKLNEFRDRLIEIYSNEKNGIVEPSLYRKSILQELESERELPDISISRPKKRLQWGIEVPNDPEQVIYVWFDALVNYLTAAGYPKNLADMPRLNHLIGKDIMRFHCIYWPSFLLAADLPIPKGIFVHSHWLMSGSKMSKSQGNVADPIELGEYYGYDSLRYFTMKYSNFETDNNFSVEKLNESRNEFIDKVCNATVRCISKNFNNFETLSKIKREQNLESYLAKISQIDLSTLDPQYLELMNDFQAISRSIDELVPQLDACITNFEMNKAVRLIETNIREINRFLDTYKPWSIKTEEHLELRGFINFVAIDSIRCTLIVLQSIIPEYSNYLLDKLKVDPKDRTVELCKIGSDLNYCEGAIHQKGIQLLISKLPIHTKE